VEEGRGRYVERPCFAPYLQALKTRNEIRKPSGMAREKQAAE